MPLKYECRDNGCDSGIIQYGFDDIIFQAAKKKTASPVAGRRKILDPIQWRA